MPETEPVAAVIAVFGGKLKPTLEPAWDIGRAIGMSGCILLTGGGAKPGKKYVKERAMDGARDAERHGGHGWRLGVLGVESARVHADERGRQLIIEPNLGDGRNYLNAALSDAAIAFPGGNGTNSEVAFALALGRPVVLLGSDWDTSFPPGEDDDAREALIGSAKERVWGTDGSALSRLVTSAYDELRRIEQLDVARYEIDHPADSVVLMTRKLATKHGLHGALPSLDDRPDLEPLAARCHQWLARAGHPE